MKLYDILNEDREDFISDRDKQAYELHQSGMYFKDIAQELGVSTTRAQQMVATYKRRAQRGGSELFDIFPPGLVRKLTADMIETIDELRDAASNNKLRLIPNIGPKALDMIHQWLEANPA